MVPGLLSRVVPGAFCYVNPGNVGRGVESSSRLLTEMEDAKRNLIVCS